MALLDSDGRIQGLFNGKLHWLDALLLGSVLIALIGVVAIKLGGHKTAGQAMLKESIPINIRVALERVQSPEADTLFTPGQQVDFTIRNRPRGAVVIDSVVVRRPKALVYSPVKPGYQWVGDLNRPDEASIVLVLNDTAAMGDDGYVAMGIKLKAGLHVTVENNDFSYAGNIISVKAIH
jgi:hypothetical protein